MTSATWDRASPLPRSLSSGWGARGVPRQPLLLAVIQRYAGQAGFRQLGQVEGGLDLVTERFHLGPDRVPALLHALDLQPQLALRRDLRRFLDPGLAHELALGIERRRVAEGGLGFALLGLARLADQAGAQVETHRGGGVLTLLDAEPAVELAADVLAFDTGAAQLRRARAVQRHRVGGDPAVLLGGALQMIHMHLAAEVEIMGRSGLLAGVDRGIAAQVAAGLQLDAPVVAALGGLRRFQRQATLACADVDAPSCDLPGRRSGSASVRWSGPH
ncbi:hypothetical protein WR25_23775 [Diploscapter pachys]|uniref:Uncharacterized protein n=1 Tax=Diploscapter pachys TaxID=2018661 RepID=A0A2A2M3Q3_9BILA|nr:hypothetical protein WR25_23775 [Diploscapter pachys]